MRATNARLIAAIAAKDLTDAYRNRTTLSIIIGTLTIMLSSMALPLLIRINAAPTAIVYDPARTAVVRALATREEYRLGFADTREEMLESLGSSSELRLGLIIPPGFASGSGADDTVTIEGYAPFWAHEADIADQAGFFETELTEASWQNVNIEVMDERGYPTLATFGQHSMVANTVAIVALTLGLALVPHLLVEEKESHTLEALLVSPANYGHVVVAKAATGVLGCCLASAIAVAMNAKWFVHGWLAVLALASGIAFTVAVGLLLGLLIENPASTNVWVGLVLLVLLLPAFLGTLVGSDLTGVVPTLIRSIPTSAVGQQLTLAMTRSPAIADWLPGALRLAAGTALIVAAIVWRVHWLETNAQRSGR